VLFSVERVVYMKTGISGITVYVDAFILVVPKVLAFALVLLFRTLRLRLGTTEVAPCGVEGRGEHVHTMGQFKYLVCYV